MILNLVPVTEYNLQRIALGQTIRIPLVSNIDVSNAREVTLLVRVISATFSGTGTAPTLSFDLAMSAPSPDGNVFVGTTAVVSAGPGQSTAPSSPTLLTGSNISTSGTTPVGGTVNLVLVYTQYVTSVTDAVLRVSIDLVLKS